MDFYQIVEKPGKNGVLEIYPDFKACRSKDLMIRGRSFYAIWDDKKHLWSTDEYDVQRLVDEELEEYAKKLRKKGSWNQIEVKRMMYMSTNMWKNYRAFLKEMSDCSVQLDNKLTFVNTEIRKTDYISKKLPYPLEEGSIDAYDEIIGTLYDPDERTKLEWAIGSVVSGDSRDIQKFIVLYGEAGAGKSTILNIIQKLFTGYYAIFDAKALTGSNNTFSTEAFKTNPLVAIQHDGDLSKIEDNTKLNSIVSHEEMSVRELYKPSYQTRFNCFLFMGTNKPVKITDAKSGIIRRLIDVKPSGSKIPPKKYHALMSQVDFELGAIAHHCLKVYQSMGKNYYSNYRPLEMIFQTDVFFNFVESYYHVFKEQDGVSLSQAYDMYKTYCDESLVEFKLARHKFREELKSYFERFSDVTRVDNKQVRSYYEGFLYNKFAIADPPKKEQPYSLVLEETESILDKELTDCPAQYATSNETPEKKWDEVKTKLSDIDTRKTHYLQTPPQHIVVDFDLKDETGKKSMQLNLEAASKWPVTYAEFSKGGAGIHLHYNYDGDKSKLSAVYSEGIEIKTFQGKASLRRKLSKCNNSPIATINSGLPLKGEKMINFDAVQSEKGLRELIARNLKKEIHPGTKPSIDFIHKVLEDAYKSGMKYDVTDLRPRILAFANNSSNQADYCIKLVNKMQFASEEHSESQENYQSDDLIFYDVEVFPNLFVVCWKKKGIDKIVKMINPSASEIENLFKFKLVGFNCRRYDNHILYARYIGYDNEQLYQLSQRIINDSRNCLFGEAYNISYTDVYDFASAGNKKGLKKFEIELGIHHQELGLPWDQPVPEELWNTVADYCCNDVSATEIVFDHLSGDWMARQILADVAGMTVNDTTNSLTTRIIFGNNKKPQDRFNYRDLSKPVKYLDPEVKAFLQEAMPIMMSKTHGPENSLLPYFPGYKYEGGKSTYRGQLVGEGGFVDSKPGMYSDVALLDVTGQHPHSGIAEVLFGVEFTRIFKQIVDGRISIKHKAWDELNHVLDGKLTPYIQRVISGEITAKELSNALKTAVNSVYGLTAAKFDNAFRDPRNIDNIVAKRGALFMIDLKYAVEEKGFTVAHIKTDSIKIPNATKEIIDFVFDFGRQYGYEFEHEETYSRFCLVNDAVYIARKKSNGEWTATGTQFAQPYLFKTLFSKEPIVFKDLFETKSVTSSLYLDMNENLAEGEHDYHFVGKVGAFCPIKPGCGGGVLLREKDGKYYAATGSKGYRWLEAEMVKVMERYEDIDKNYYNNMVDQAIKDISKYGDFEWFLSDDKISSCVGCKFGHKPRHLNCDDCIGGSRFIKEVDTPPWALPCGKEDSDTCRGCEELCNDGPWPLCKLGSEYIPILKEFNPCPDGTKCDKCDNWITEVKNQPNDCKLGYDALPF